MKTWFVKFPTYQYNEDVVAIAKEKGLKIIDAQFDDGSGIKDAPALTIKGEEPKKRTYKTTESKSEEA